MALTWMTKCVSSSTDSRGSGPDFKQSIPISPLARSRRVANGTQKDSAAILKVSDEYRWYFPLHPETIKLFKELDSYNNQGKLNVNIDKTKVIVFQNRRKLPKRKHMVL